MKRAVVTLFLTALLCGAARADLHADVRAILLDKSLKRVEVGVQIARVQDDGAASVLFELNSRKAFIPASNLKVLTTAAALERLGAEFRFRTILFVHDGDVIIWGGGDPTLGDAEMLKAVGWDVTTVFESWASQLKQQGITQVRNVVVDDSIFDTEFLHPNWPKDQEHKRYVAQVGGLNLNANCVDFLIGATRSGSTVTYQLNPKTQYVTIRNQCVTGNENAIWLSRMRGGNDVILRGETRASLDAPVSVTIHDPPMFAATVFAETLRKSGVAVNGTVMRDRTTHSLYAAKGNQAFRAIAVHETPLSMVLARANKDSMNLYAEALCKRLGHEATKQPGSWQNGTAAMAGFLESLGVPATEFKVDDGCGLSKENRISPNALVRVLVHNFAAKHREPFLASLAIAGVDGTLEDRFGGSDLQSRVFGKSGYVNGVRALSGYLHAKNGQWYAFSILMNGPDGGNAGMKTIQERIVQAIDSNASK